MLRLSDLHASYGAAAVLQGVSLAVDQGETVALLGPNGAGKSTLLAAITGTIPRRQGRIDLDGVDLSRQQSHAIVASGVALVPEGRLVFAPFRVEDNLRLGAVRLQGELAERFDYVYTLFPRLAERRRQPAGTLSGGEQQMLAIGRALMSKPRLLLLDEPFLGLAPLVVSQIRDALEKLRASGMTMLMVEQKLDIALQFAQRAYVLIKGKVVLEDSTASLARRTDLRDLYFSLATTSSPSSARSMA
jgi:branched-chain amino acid transport system ATP-binding protein